jgi:hypothetical protein
MKRGLDKARQAPPPAPTEHWALGERYQGLAGAQLVIVNLYGDNDRARAESLCREIHRVDRPHRRDPTPSHGTEASQLVAGDRRIALTGPSEDLARLPEVRTS